MRRAVLSLAVISGSIFFAVPARADHVVDILSDGVTCRAGALETGIGVDLLTTDVKFLYHAEGWVESFTCRFRDIPTFVPAEESELGTDWNLPDHKVTQPVSCWRSQEGERVDGTGTLTIKPNRIAMVTCNFTQAPG